MYQALYRKYRPTTFDDVCGQEHITSVLKTQLQKGRVSHAYLFCGSRGTGKTTCAKILAKAVNCEKPEGGEPCNQCATCTGIDEERILDVVEMDAASNNGVDHIRRLCDEVQFLPAEAKKRVYIIDEVHMLSTSAFNALLKTIEEPPAHVLFILATTEINSIPATILSRCQRFDFKRIEPSVISNRLMEISKKEEIPLQKDAADVIAHLSDGAMRDALSLLEACQGSKGDVTAEKVRSLLGLGSRASVLALCRAIAEQDVKECLQLLRSIYQKMSDFKEVLGELIFLYRDLLVIKSVPDYENYVEGYENEIPELVEISKKISTETVLYQVQELERFYASYDRIAAGKNVSSEILMIRLCQENLSQDLSALLSRISKLEKNMAFPSRKSSPPEASRQKDARPLDQIIQKEDGSKTLKQDSESGEYVGSLKLKNALQVVPYIKPWLGQIRFLQKGTSLILSASPFVNGLLLSSDAKIEILNAAKKLDPEIEKLDFEETRAEETAENSEFEGL